VDLCLSHAKKSCLCHWLSCFLTVCAFDLLIFYPLLCNTLFRDIMGCRLILCYKISIAE